MKKFAPSSLSHLVSDWPFWLLLSAPLLVGAIFVSYYLNSFPAGASHSLFDSTWSLAYATWALVVFTATAFTAAVVAAYYARRAFQLETACALEQRVCGIPDHRKEADVRVFIDSDNTVRINETPPSFLAARRNWNRQDHAFINLRRATLFRVSVDAQFNLPTNATSINATIELGSIGGDLSEIHVTIRWHRDLEQLITTWSNARHWFDGVEGKNEPLRFYPMPQGEVTTTLHR